MAIIGDALRQAFMPKREYESLRDEDKAWLKLQRPALVLVTSAVCGLILACTIVSLKIVFPGDGTLKRPFCSDRRVLPLSIDEKGGDADALPGAFYLTDAETVDYYWMVVFVPSAIIFAVSAVYLVAGFTVAYSAPTRHGCLKVVENNYCASRRVAFGGCVATSFLCLLSGTSENFFINLNGFRLVVSAVFLFSMSPLLSYLAFWRYFWVQASSHWAAAVQCPCFGAMKYQLGGLSFCTEGLPFFLRRKAAIIIDGGEYGSRTLGLEMLEANPLEVTPDVERRVNEGFKTWMGSSLLSSDEEDEPESYVEVPQPILTDFSGQRV